LWEDNVALRTAARRFGPDALVTFTTHISNVDDLVAELPVKPTACNFILYIGMDDKAKDAQLFDATGESGRELTDKDVSLWTINLSKAELTVRNWYPKDINIYWIDEGKDEIHVGRLAHGQSTALNTWMTHIFTMREVETNKLIQYAIVNRASAVFEIRPAMTYPTEDEFVRKAFDLWFDVRRLKNWFQPNIVPAITPTGFAKQKAPKKLFDDVLQFFKQMEPHQRLETSVGPCINQEEAPTYMVSLSHDLRERIFAEFKPILENWSNLVLKPTSLYGIRKYTHGSVLKMHVDTLDTHVISCIVNVAQDVDEDWLLEILDHEGNLHKIAMEPGDMVLYESAKALHGRPVSLKGRQYSNFFLHYAPENMPWSYGWL
jgi:hypothetical protein